jgi:hypothetical protein
MLPPTLRVLQLPAGFSHPLENIRLPASLEQLIWTPATTIRATWSHPIEHLQLVVWPRKLKVLTFGKRFEHSIEAVSFPSTLETLSCSTR